MSQANVQERPIVSVTEQAAAVLKQALAADSASIIRFLATRQGDKIQHDIRIESQSAPEDVVYEQHELTIAVSPEDAPILAGSELDYRGEGEAGRFVMDNPNVGR